MNDLLEELRACGVLTPSDVGTAIMETSGKLSVFQKSQTRPLTPEDMNIRTNYEGIPLTLVMDGKTEKSNLAICGRDESWLMKQLKRMGFQSTQEVLLCYLDTDGRMTAHPYSSELPTGVQAMAADEVMW